MSDDGAQRVGVADYRDRVVRVPEVKAIELLDHTHLRLQHEFAAGSANAAAERIKPAPLLQVLQFCESEAFPLSQSHFTQGIDALGIEPMPARDGFRRFNGPLQWARVDRLQRYVCQPVRQQLHLLSAV